MDRDADAVVSYLRRHAGQTLQAVVVHDASRHRVLFAREDVGEPSDRDVETVLDRFRRRDGTQDGATAAVHGGALRATVQLFEGRVVLHLPRDETSGTLVFLDTAAARNLRTFVEDIRADVYSAAVGETRIDEDRTNQ